MLPCINAQQRLELANDRVLVLRFRQYRPRTIFSSTAHSISLDQHVPRVFILNQPCPPASLNTRQRSIEFALEIIHTAVPRPDRLLELTTGWLPPTLTFRRQILPEK